MTNESLKPGSYGSGGEISPAPRIEAEATARCQNCDALGSAIAQAARKAGIYNGDVALDGPQLIMLCDDLARASALCTPIACGTNPVLPSGRVGCGRHIMSELELFRCAQCSVPFHRECLRSHFGEHAEAALALVEKEGNDGRD